MAAWQYADAVTMAVGPPSSPQVGPITLAVIVMLSLLLITAAAIKDMIVRR